MKKLRKHVFVKIICETFFLISWECGGEKLIRGNAEIMQIFVQQKN